MGAAMHFFCHYIIPVDIIRVYFHRRSDVLNGLDYNSITSETSSYYFMQLEKFSSTETRQQSLLTFVICDTINFNWHTVKLRSTESHTT